MTQSKKRHRNVLSRREEALDVTRDLVDLEVHAGTNFELAEGCDRLGVRNDVDAEGGTFDFVDGEADAVDGYGAFASDVTCEVGGDGDFEARGASVTGDGDNFGDTIDVT
jgi:hypothetical protein